jgi:integrase
MKPNPETCPVRTIQPGSSRPHSWAAHYSGRLTGTGRYRRAGCPVSMWRVVKKLALRTGLDATAYAGHSLRAGHATSAAIAGASEWSIMKQTGHRSVQMVRRYIRDGSLFRENSAGKLGL